MADFCNECAKENGFPEGDFNYVRIIDGEPVKLKEGEGWVELCEGCGMITVDDSGNKLGSLK